MDNNLQLTNFFQCPHHNKGYCKFCDQCRYPHLFTICSKSVCRDQNCQSRHPKVCRYGEACKFEVLKACAYKHSETELERKEQKDNLEIESLKKEIEILRGDISELKNKVRKKEEKLEEKFKYISKMEKKISELENENENLKKHVAESKKVVKNDEKIKSKLNTKFHLSSKNSENSDNGVTIRANCDKCDFQSTDQFSLLLHKSTKHPTYILNSQPEAVTGPLH